jgi:hypothetical protein
MGVEGSRGGGARAQVLLDEAEVDTRREPMGRPGVAKGVETRPLGDAARSQGSAEGVLHAGSGHGRGSRGQLRSPAARSWDAPDRLARGAPVAASPLTAVLGQGDLGVLAPVALAAMEAHARRVQVAHLPRCAFLQPPSASIDGGEAETVAGEPHAGEEGPYLRGAEEDRAFLCPRGSAAGQRGPVPSPGGRLNKLEAA